VVPVGAPAFEFCIRNREKLFRDVSILGAGIDRRHLAGVDLGDRTTAVCVDIGLVEIVEGVLQVLPATKSIGVVIGSSPLEAYWVSQMRREWQPFADRVAFEWFNGLTLPQIRDRVASLPAHSAVVFALLDVDAAGVPYELNLALDAVHQSTNAPIFGFFEPELGHGTVGGRMIDVRAVGEESARTALRILRGESPAAIPPVTMSTTPPVFDARELKRWGIAPSLLPPGSEVRFREPSVLEAYRGHILLLGALFLVQSVVIAMYATSRLRLKSARAELVANESSMQELRRDLSHAGRVSLLGQFTASLAHELGQPLGAILRNAEAAELFLKGDSPDIEEVQAILSDVRKDGQRAGDVIERLRGLLRRRGIDMHPLVWDDLVSEVMHIVRADAHTRAITVEVEAAPGLPRVRGDRIHIQQVLLNLVANAMDAVEGDSSAERRVTVSARSDGNGFVECAVCDTGTGIAPGQAQTMFEPFATTKETGMGMGLPISRTIVEAHGGRLWAENNPDRGVTFRFTIPVFAGGEGHD
jgi:signal transduction histidine kinase